MANHGWSHDVPGDAVHFDHLGSTDHRGQDVHAFQVLWNQNHPGDQIAADGAYGPQTEARLKQAPATGFSNGPSCTQPSQFAADVVSVDGPDQVPPATRAHYAITLKNTGNVDWPAGTKLQLATDPSSPLHDSSWTSATVITTIGAAVPAGMKGTVEFDVMTPAETAQTPISEDLELDDAGHMFGTFTFALTVVPGMTGPTSGDGGDPGASSSGCSAGGAGTGGPGEGFVLVLGAIARAARRRRG
jgi:hypothetical protein